MMYTVAYTGRPVAVASLVDVRSVGEEKIALWFQNSQATAWKTEKGKKR
jgi:hypothetical protein